MAENEKEEGQQLLTISEFFKDVKKQDFKRYIKLKDGKQHRIKFKKKAPVLSKGDYGMRLEYEVIEDQQSKILTTSPFMMSCFLKTLTKHDLTEKDIGGNTFNIKRTGKRDNTKYFFELIK